MATKIKLIADNVITTSQIDTSSLDSHFTGGTGVTYSSGTISIGQAVHSTDSPTFADLTLTGNLNITGDINSYNVTDLDVTDQTITLGAGQTEALSGGSGIIVDGSSASLLWDETNTEWDFNNNVHISAANGELKLTSTANSNNNLRLYQGTNSYLIASNNVYMSANSNSDMFNLVNGNVGIGEASPVTPLHVKMATGKNILFQDALSSAAIKFTTDAGAGYAAGTINGSSLAINADSGGNLAVGGTTPVAKLHVQGTGTSGQVTTSFLLENASSGTAGMDITGAAGSSRLRFLYGGGPSTGTNTLTEALGITLEGSGAGRVGIGSGVTAAGSLHIDDGSNNVDLRITSDLGGGNPAALRLLAYGAGGDNWIQSGTANSGGTRAPLKFSGSDGNYICTVMNQTLGVTEGAFLRANNWFNNSINTVGGPALEIGYTGSSGYVHGYNRNASSYIPVSYDGSEHRWYKSGTGPYATLNTYGQFLINFSNVASTSNFLLGVDGGIGLGGDDLIASGAGYGPSNSSAGAGTLKLYDTGTGNMNFNQTYTYARYYFYHGGNEVFRIEDGGFSGIYGYSFHYTTQYGSVGVGALNSGYHHTMVQSGPSTFYWSNPCQASGGFSTYSDERLKENITTITGALDKVALMNGVTFNWIDAENRGGGNTGKQFGVTAQNMLEVDPELPTLLSDPLETQENIDNEELETDYYTMDYSRITPFLIEAIKELKTKLEAAEARITELEG